MGEETGIYFAIIYKVDFDQSFKHCIMIYKMGMFKSIFSHIQLSLKSLVFTRKLNAGNKPANLYRVPYNGKLAMNLWGHIWWIRIDGPVFNSSFVRKAQRGQPINQSKGNFWELFISNFFPNTFHLLSGMCIGTYRNCRRSFSNMDYQMSEEDQGAWGPEAQEMMQNGGTGVRTHRLEKRLIV